MVLHRNVEYYIGETSSRKHAIHVKTTQKPHCSHEFKNQTFLNVYTRFANDRENICPVCESKTGDPEEIGMKIALAAHFSNAYELIGPPKKRPSGSEKSIEPDEQPSSGKQSKLEYDPGLYPDADEMEIVDFNVQEALTEFGLFDPDEIPVEFEDLDYDVRMVVIRNMEDPRDVIRFLMTNKEIYDWFKYGDRGWVVFLYMVKKSLEIVFPRVKLQSTLQQFDSAKNDYGQIDLNKIEYDTFDKALQRDGIAKDKVQNYKNMLKLETKCERMSDFLGLMRNYNLVWLESWTKKNGAAEFESIKTAMTRELLSYFSQLDLFYDPVFFDTGNSNFLGAICAVTPLVTYEDFGFEGRIGSNEHFLWLLEQRVDAARNHLDGVPEIRGSTAYIAIMSGHYGNLIRDLNGEEDYMEDYDPDDEPLTREDLYGLFAFPRAYDLEGRQYAVVWFILLMTTYNNNPGWNELALMVLERIDFTQQLPANFYVEAIRHRNTKSPVFDKLFSLINKLPLKVDKTYDRIYLKKE